MKGTNRNDDFVGCQSTVCVVFDDSVTLPQDDQAACGPRKGLNLPAAFRFYRLLSAGKRGRPAYLKEGAS
jgi:hypothetical protein